MLFQIFFNFFCEIFFELFWLIDRQWRRKQSRDDDDDDEKTQKPSKTIRKWFKTAEKSHKNIPQIVRFRMGALLWIVLKFLDKYGIWYFNFAPKCRIAKIARAVGSKQDYKPRGRTDGEGEAPGNQKPKKHLN